MKLQEPGGCNPTFYIQLILADYGKKLENTYQEKEGNKNYLLSYHPEGKNCC